MTIVDYQYVAATILGGDYGSVVYGPTLTSTPALLPGDKAFFAWSDDSNQGVDLSGPPGASDVNDLGPYANNGLQWNLYSIYVTRNVAANSPWYFSPLGTNIAYAYVVMWIVRGANATNPVENIIMGATTGTSTQTFNVTTNNNNDCVLCVVCPTPPPTDIVRNTITSWTTTTTGWTSYGPAQDHSGANCFYIINNPNVSGTAPVTTTVTSTVSGGTGVRVLYFKIKK